MLIGDLGEESLLDELRRIFAAVNDKTIVGIGDDAAVIQPAAGKKQAWTSDLMIQGVHFETSWQTPEQLGRKSLAINISDLASMGATPEFALISLAIDPGMDADYILGLCRGFRDGAALRAIQVLGGDTSSSDGALVISIALGGRLEGREMLRSGAGAGDAIIVTGELGSAACGLRMLQQGTGDAGFPGLVDAFLSPPDRLEAGFAARDAGATAMTDVSDGIASDLRHICEESRVGARVFPERMPLAEEMRAACERYGWDCLKMALTGGEDYELLLTAPSHSAADVVERLRAAGAAAAAVIGEVTPAGSGISMIDEEGAVSPMPARGYEHFGK